MFPWNITCLVGGMSTISQPYVNCRYTVWTTCQPHVNHMSTIYIILHAQFPQIKTAIHTIGIKKIINVYIYWIIFFLFLQLKIENWLRLHFSRNGTSCSVCVKYTSTMLQPYVNHICQPYVSSLVNYMLTICYLCWIPF